jgi:TetR/AcrR family transcriptional regulator
MSRLKGNIASTDETVRGHLLVSALKLFNQKGYAGTTVREIVADAGVTKPVLYYYFGNKEGIYLELLEGPLRKFEELLENFCCEGGKASEKLKALCESSFQFYCENIEKAKLMNAIYYGPPQGAPYLNFEAYHAKLFNTIGQLVEEGIRTNEFRELDVKDIILAIVGAFHIAMDIMLCQTPAITISQDVLSRILNVIFQGILKKE